MQDIAQRILNAMASGVGGVLPTFQETTGRFISEPEGPPAPDAAPEDIGWCVINQDIIYPLAVLYKTPGTPFFGDDDVLHQALRGGDAIRDFQQEDGRVEFLKADGSRWGSTYMAWTNYAWLEAFVLLHDELGDERRARWQEGLALAHNGQAREIGSLHVHNIPCWKGMSCYRAGDVFERQDWRDAGAAMCRAVAEAQRPGGYWAEHGGPSSVYNHVYMHALGLYYVFSGDQYVLPALRAGAEFHQTFVYPDGIRVETVDGRVQYRERIMHMGWPGFAVCAKGRRLVRHLVDCFDPDRDVHSFQGGSLASAAQHLTEGNEEPILLDTPRFREAYEDWAIICRDGPWFGCLSAFVCPPVASRWGEDRQSFLSLWHRDRGLVLGGGNSQEQPEWSSFVADGRYVPDAGKLLSNNRGIALTYGTVTCHLDLSLEADRATVTARSERGAARHQLVLQVRPGERIRSAAGREAVLGESPLRWRGIDLGAWLDIGSLRIGLPRGAEFHWPTMPFNPYAADGAAAYGAERGLLTAHVDSEPACWTISPSP